MRGFLSEVSVSNEIVMDPEEMLANARSAALFLKGLANQNRLMILCTLAQGEQNVSDLEEKLGIRQPTLSQQLARLRSEGLVDTRRDAKSIYYSLASDEAREIIGLLYQLFCSSPDVVSPCRAAG